MVTRVVCWNIANRQAPWDELVAMDADVALLQEAGQVPDHVAGKFSVGAREHWDSHVWNSDWHSGRWDRLFDRWPMVVKLSDRVGIEWFKQVGPISEPAEDEMAVSGIGTIAAARVTPHDGEPFIAVSMYARWLKPHGSTNTNWRVGHSDGSAHRIITDLSAFIGHKDPGTHRILAAGDLNMIYGATEDNRLALPTRERTVFDRMAALGLEFLGPQFPDGRQAELTPQGLPADTLNVPTFRNAGKSPETAKNQLDYAFASHGFHQEITVRAMNSPEEWGSSDHCRLWIEVGAS
ncbi:MAG: hypothetical protein KTV68_02295 [Acidimicrobiia bacterium]|nr:hypothetical protein [Acidimicrobiia bacterium]